jgi:hypothetical protein
MRIKRLLSAILIAALAVALFVPAALADEVTPDGVFYVDEEDISTPTTPGGSGGGDTPSIDPTKNGKYWLDVELWNAGLAQTSMGNVAFQGIKALLTTTNGVYKLHVGTRPVEVSGYTTAITDVQLSDSNQNGGSAVPFIKTGTFTTNTKFDGVAHVLDPTIQVFELTLTDTTAQYIWVRFKVPYTPMDAVGASTDGWLYARVRIYWNSITDAPGSAEVDPPTSIAQGSSSLDSSSGSGGSESGASFDGTDAATGIRITAADGVVPEDAVVKVTEIKETSSGTALKAAYDSAEAALEDTAVKFALFDISITSGGAEIQPNGTITLRIPIPDGFDKSKTALYRINDDSTATLIRGNVSGSFYIASLSRLSLYALVEGYEATASPADAFTDIEGHWAYDYIRYGIERGLYNGVTETEFNPSGTMTRAMFVTVLGRIAGVDVTAYGGKAFDDVPEGEWFSAYVKWAAEKGVVSGVGDNKYNPEAFITREQMARMLFNYVEFAGITLKSADVQPFADADEISDWATAAVEAMARAGIVNGVGENRFAPKNTASRAEVATLLSRFVQEYVD